MPHQMSFEILTQVDDGRLRAYEAITGKPIPKPGVPESFRFLSKNCNLLVLSMRVLDEDDQEVELRDLDEGMDEDVIHVDDLEKPAKKQHKRLKRPLKLKKLRKQQKRKQQKKLLNKNKRFT